MGSIFVATRVRIGNQETEAVRQRFEHPFRENEAALLGARLEDLEDELLLAHAGGARDVELLRDLRQRADAHVLERRELDLLYFFGGSGGAVASCGLRLLLG